MTTKHTPATPLPWRVHGQWCGITSASALEIGERPEQTLWLNKPRDAAYIAHAANAYPLAVEFAHAIAEALDGDRNRFGRFQSKSINQGDRLRQLAVKYDAPPARDFMDQAAFIARALLRELGEDA